jgi:hypothetical protein
MGKPSLQIQRLGSCSGNRSIKGRLGAVSQNKSQGYLEIPVVYPLPSPTDNQELAGRLIPTECGQGQITALESRASPQHVFRSPGLGAEATSH